MSPLISLLRNGRARIALAAALVSLTVPAAAHADLIQGAPSQVQGGYFDDHSIGTDNHMGWSYSGSDSEPLAITFGTTLTNSSGSPLRVCGYASGTSAGWMLAFEVSGACPGAAPTGQDGWFRYITANHDDPARHLFNRWHVMDLQRFALVPLPASAGGPAGASTAWDTYWGTCLSDGGESMDCEQSEAAATLSTAIAAGAAKTTQELNPAPDAERIAIPADAIGQFPDGLYQVVAIANPYGQYSGPRSIACTTISLSGLGAYAPVATQVERDADHVLCPRHHPGRAHGAGGTRPDDGRDGVQLHAANHRALLGDGADGERPRRSVVATPARRDERDDGEHGGRDQHGAGRAERRYDRHAGLGSEQPAGDGRACSERDDPHAHGPGLAHLRPHGAAQAVRSQREPAARVVPRAVLDRVDLHGLLPQVRRPLQRPRVAPLPHGQQPPAVAVPRGDQEAQERPDADDSPQLPHRGDVLSTP